MTISLGSHDAGLGRDALADLLLEMRRLSGAPWDSLHDERGAVPFRVVTPGAREEGGEPGVADVQRVLSRAGFFDGGRVDGICGYRTRAAVRLFQEYVRSVERRPCLPDGIVGPRTAAELRRWEDAGLEADWSPRLAAWRRSGEASADGEFGEWLAFLRTLAAHRVAAPDAMAEAVAAFRGESDTRVPAEWLAGPGEVHLIGVRHDERARVPRFDDVLVLLLKGLVFQFQGSTDPGATSHPDGAPFLVPGQHDFRMGLHRGSYHALRPLHHASHGVLVVRCRSGLVPTPADIAAGVEVNGTINIHWGGKGLGFPVDRWSEGCQVIAGGGYRNHAGDIVDCLGHVGVNNGAVVASGGRKTRGAYDVLSDLIVAMSGDLASPGVVRYTLANESELALAPGLAARLADTRAAAARRIADPAR